MTKAVPSVPSLWPLPHGTVDEQTEALYRLIETAYAYLHSLRSHGNTVVREVRDHTDAKHDRQHSIGATADHTATTLALLNALISDATLDDSGDSRPATSHDLDAHGDVNAPSPTDQYGLGWDNGTSKWIPILYVRDADFGAHAMLIGTGAGGAGPVTVGVNEMVGRKASGDIVNLTAGEVRSVVLSEQSKINDPSGGATVDTEARTAIEAIIDALEANDISAV